MNPKIFVRIAQHVSPRPTNIEEVEKYLKDGGKGVDVVVSNERPVATWGSGVYSVNEETGEMALLIANWDSSG